MGKKHDKVSSSVRILPNERKAARVRITEIIKYNTRTHTHTKRKTKKGFWKISQHFV